MPILTVGFSGPEAFCELCEEGGRKLTADADRVLAMTNFDFRPILYCQDAMYSENFTSLLLVCSKK